MKRIVVDPVTRIEGHLRVEVSIDETTGQVNDALSSGTAWRGIEVVLKDRDPRDTWAFAQRFCGVCTTMHALGSVRAIEDALGIQIPKNANYIRNIMAGVQMVHDHLVHFYHLHALDWVSPLEALKADPAKAAELQNVILEKYSLNVSGPSLFQFEAYPKDFPKATTAYLKEIQAKVKKIVDSGQLGIFAAHWWDHPDYTLLPPEVHLLAISHYLNTLDRQRDIVGAHVVFGGKNPHPHYAVGGMPCAISMNDMNAPVNSARLAVVEASINMVINLTNLFYIPDVLAIGHLYAQKGMLDGGGLSKTRVLGYGDYPEDTYTGISNGDFHRQIIFRCNGVVENFSKGVANATFYNLEGKDLSDPNVLTEGIDHSWYVYPENKDLHPFSGVSQGKFTGPKEGTKTNWKYLDEKGRYSWVKTPKWRGNPMEVGPLARYIITYTKVKQGIIQPNWVEKMVVDQIDGVSKVLGAAPEVWLPSTVGRTAARALESQVCAYLAKYYFDKLIKNIQSGDTTVMNNAKWQPSSWPSEARGIGIHEAPRGSLGHWVSINNGKTSNYQAIVPTTWNACPRDDKAGHGAFESCMIDTKVKIPEKPLEILKGIRSFDPCLACATHLYNADGKEISMVSTDVFQRNKEE